ncbi:hypothetical protein T439DRAFT_344994 [Meredithblackwellia eburnea MCA 4105]
MQAFASVFTSTIPASPLGPLYTAHPRSEYHAATSELVSMICGNKSNNNKKNKAIKRVPVPQPRPSSGPSHAQSRVETPCPRYTPLPSTSSSSSSTSFTPTSPPPNYEEATAGDLEDVLSYYYCQDEDEDAEELSIGSAEFPSSTSANGPQRLSPEVVEQRMQQWDYERKQVEGQRLAESDRAMAEALRQMGISPRPCVFFFLDSSIHTHAKVKTEIIVMPIFVTFVTPGWVENTGWN